MIGPYLRARLLEPSTVEAVGWFAAFIAWAKIVPHWLEALLMVCGGICMLLGAILPEGRRGRPDD